MTDPTTQAWHREDELRAELRHLRAENAHQHHMTNKLAQDVLRLRQANSELLEALSDVAYGLEGARIWGGMEWSYNPLHPFKYLPLRDKARAAIAKHGSNE